MSTNKNNIVLVDFDHRLHEITLDCVLTFRGYAETSVDSMDLVTADLAECLNKYRERACEIKKVETARVKEGAPTVSGSSVTSG